MHKQTRLHGPFEAFKSFAYEAWTLNIRKDEDAPCAVKCSARRYGPLGRGFHPRLHSWLCLCALIKHVWVSARKVSEPPYRLSLLNRCIYLIHSKRSLKPESDLYGNIACHWMTERLGLLNRLKNLQSMVRI